MRRIDVMKIRRKAGVGTVLLVLLVCMMFASSLYAADQWLFSIDGLDSPYKVAVTPDGKVLVYENGSMRMKVYDLSGEQLDVFAVGALSALAVGPDGKIYLGRGQYSTNTPPYSVPGEVKVNDGNFNYLYSLGTNGGALIHPIDIDVTTDGMVYVVDSSADKVLVYNPDGSFAFEFGSTGAGDDKFNLPLSIEIDNATGDVYVADKDLITSSDGSGLVGGARVKVFDSAGNAIPGRAFGVYDIGDLISPSDMLLRGNKMYIADSYQNLIQVYDVTTGQYLETLRDPDRSIRGAASIDASTSGITVLSSNRTGAVHVFGLDGFTSFTLAPASISLDAYEGAVVANAANVVIENTGSSAIDWTAAATECLTVDASGTVDTGASATIAIGIDASACAAGSYAGSITVTDQNNISQSVAVDLNVTAAPTLTVSDGSLEFSADVNGADPQPQGIVVSLQNAPAGSVWTAGANEGWLQINPVQAGGGDTDATVSVSVAGLPSGVYNDVITISSDVTASVAVAVQLTIINTTSISVSTNLDGSPFTIEGPGGVAYEGQGSAWSATGVAPGEYTISYGDVQGYTTPAGETATVSVGGSIAFTGEYAAIVSMNIVATSENSNGVNILNSNGDVIDSLEVDGAHRRGGLDNAVADVDGDGDNEIILAAMDNGSTVMVAGLKGDDKFSAFERADGVTVSAGDLNGDGAAELIVTSVRNGNTKVFTYAGGEIYDSGASLSEGDVLVAAADLDGNGTSEIVLVSKHGHSIRTRTVLQVCSADTKDGVGNWNLKCDEVVGMSGDVDAIAAADIDGDGTDEIIGADKKDVVTINAEKGTTDVLFTADHKVNDVAAADINGDGNVEVVTGGKGGGIAIYTLNGTEIDGKQLYHNGSGVRVSLGVLGY